MHCSLEHLLGHFLFGALNVIAAILVLSTLFLRSPAGLTSWQSMGLALLLWFIIDCLLLWCRRLIRDLTAANSEGVVLRMVDRPHIGRQLDDEQKGR